MVSTISIARRLAWTALAAAVCQGNAADLPAAERDAHVSAPQAEPAVATPGPGCVFPSWAPSLPYSPLTIVTYGSRPYFAKYENPGYNPTISTYFWGAYSCPVSTAPRCTYGEWMRDWPYQAGSVVMHEGNLYIAKVDNPGYVPTISTYFWAPHRCEDPMRTTAVSR